MWTEWHLFISQQTPPLHLARQTCTRLDCCTRSPVHKGSVSVLGGRGRGDILVRQDMALPSLPPAIRAAWPSDRQTVHSRRPRARASCSHTHTHPRTTMARRSRMTPGQLQVSRMSRHSSLSTLAASFDLAHLAQVDTDVPVSFFPFVKVRKVGFGRF